MAISRITASFFFVLFIHFAYGQCPEDDVSISTQYGLDLFTSKYPDCTKLNGNLSISGSDIFAWDRLPDFESVAGNFSISNIREKHGVEKIIGNLKYVGGDINISYIPFEAEQGLFLVDQGVVNGDISLYSYDFSSWDFTNIKEINGRLSINYCSGVENLDQFENLNSVNSISLWNNPDLVEIYGLDNVNITPSSISINGNSQLQFCNLSIICESIARDSSVVIAGNGGGNCNNITAIYKSCGFGSEICKQLDVTLSTQEEVDSFNVNYKICLDSIRRLTVDGNIYNLDSLYRLTVIDHLTIYADSLEELEGLNGLTYIRDLGIHNAAKLKNLNGLENVNGLKEISIGYCPELEHINSLNLKNSNINDISLISLPNLGGNPIRPDSILNQVKLQWVAQSTVDLFEDVSYINSLIVSYSPLVTDVNQLIDENIPPHVSIWQCGVTEVELGIANSNLEGFSCYGNDNLRSVTSNSDIGKIEYFSLRDNPRLENISLSNITSIEYMSISGSDQIVAIDIMGLDSLTNLYISYNELLEDISFLNNIKSQLESIEIRFNPALEICAYPVVCDYINSFQSKEHFFFGANGEGCNLMDLPCVYAGDIYTRLWIETQEDMDNVALQYPNADSIFAEVRVNKFDGDLSYFEQIEYIDTTLLVYKGSASLVPFENCNIMELRLDNYEGNEFPVFKNLDSINTLDIRSCYYLSDLTPFSNVKNISSSLSLRNIWIDNLDDLHDSIMLNSVTLEYLNIDNLNGLQHLKKLDRLAIDRLGSLNNLGDLYQLDSLNSLKVEDCYNLVELFAEDQIDHINGIDISSNDNLKNITGFERIVNLPYLTISDNDNIHEVTSFPQLTNDSITNGQLRIERNHRLKNISMPNLKNLNRLDVKQNDSIQVMTFSEELSISYSIWIAGNKNFDVCNVEWICNNLDQTDRITIIDNSPDCFNFAQILESCGLEPPRCPSSSIMLNSTESIIAYNETYSTCEIIPGILTISIPLDSSIIEPKLDSLRKVDYLRVNRYFQKESFTLPNLEVIESTLEMTGSGSLKQIDFPEINKVSEVRLTSNSNMTDLDWLPNIPFSVLDIQSNNSLKSVSFEHDFGFPSFLRIKNNPILEDIGHQDWDFEINSLNISDNEMLTDITGLENTILSQTLYISGNDNLSDCSITSICNGLELSDFFTIEENGTNCNSTGTVSFYCANPNSLDEEDDLKINVFPNPVNSRLKIDCTSSSFVSARVKSIDGSDIMNSSVQEINMSHLPSGIYLLTVNTNEGSRTFKIVKL